MSLIEPCEELLEGKEAGVVCAHDHRVAQVAHGLCGGSPEGGHELVVLEEVVEGWREARRDEEVSESEREGEAREAHQGLQGRRLVACRPFQRA
jgi:hypothetical protein